jgi:hypothetical protein
MKPVTRWFAMGWALLTGILIHHHAYDYAVLSATATIGTMLDGVIDALLGAR